METTLLKVSLRQNAIFIPQEATTGNHQLNGVTSVFAANAAKLGFTFSEPLLQHLNRAVPAYKMAVLDLLREVSGAGKNWTPLVKGWDMPTGEGLVDHLVTFFANLFKTKGTQLPCGHIIPAGTFPLERYNGCPFCGTPFNFGTIEQWGQGSKLKVLELWQDTDMEAFLTSLLNAKTALDATQADSLKLLLEHYALPDQVTIRMKETLMLVIDVLKASGKIEAAQGLFSTPADIMRYLWYKQTGLLQIVEPRTLLKKAVYIHTHIYRHLSTGAQAAIDRKHSLRLKYSRKDCLVVATWLNNLDIDTNRACESMHPKRGMWIRFIRALRLAEYAKRKGFERLKALLDRFYNQDYPVWQGKVSQFRLKYDAVKAFDLLKQRPGLFARSLFANMLWFGADDTIAAFTEVVDEVPARLVFTLGMYACSYFDPDQYRSVKPLGGGHSRRIAPNRLLQLYTEAQLQEMKTAVEELCLSVMKYRFAAQPTTSRTIFIDPALYHMPVAIGERSQTLQDLPVALMGTRFPLEGDQVRLFMQWGKDMPAQHLDMDLSCHIAYRDHNDICSFSRLVTTGCKHSGDIRHIPNRIGTAEYINLDVAALAAAEAQYVTFTCNAYSNGALTPNLVVGWMDSKYPMQVSEKSGVAYDPSCVQHQVRVTQHTDKGLVFGVLDVAAREIIWLEAAFGGQVVQGLDFRNVKALMNKLGNRLNIGRLLSLKAEAQSLTLVHTADADEVYDTVWARNAAAVTQLLID